MRSAGDMLGGQMEERRSRRLPGVGLSRCFIVYFSHMRCLLKRRLFTYFLSVFYGAYFRVRCQINKVQDVFLDTDV